MSAKKYSSSNQLKGLSLDLMRLFIEVTERRSLSAAAKELGISVSTASRDLQRLEKNLGVRLFERSTRSLKPTQAGITALAWVSDVLGGYENVLDDLSALTGRPAGPIRLVVTHYVAANYLPSILSGFCEHYPEITISVTTTDEYVDMIAEGVDVMVHSGRPSTGDIVGVRIGDSQRVLCATPSYLTRFGVPKHPKDLAAHRLLVHATNEPKVWGFRRGKNVSVTSITPYLAVDSHLLLRELVRKGLGIARFGRLIVEDDLQRGTLRQIMPGYVPAYPDGGESAGIWVLYPSRHLVLRTRLFVDFLIKSLKNRRNLS